MLVQNGPELVGNGPQILLGHFWDKPFFQQQQHEQLWNVHMSENRFVEHMFYIVGLFFEILTIIVKIE